MSSNLLKEEKLAIIKTLVEKIQKEFKCRVKFMDTYKVGQKVFVKEGSGIISKVNSPNSYDIKIADRLIESVKYNAISLTCQEKLNESIDTIDSLHTSIRKMMKKVGITRFKSHKSSKDIKIRGEFDTTQFNALQSELLAFGLAKDVNKSINGEMYMTYRTQDTKFSVAISKPKA